jgi:hypothetical protein
MEAPRISATSFDHVRSGALMRPRRAPTLTGVLVALGVCVAGSSADAAGSTSFRGKTSQGRGISFKLDGGSVTELQYHIDDRCPGGRLLFVHNWGFPALPVMDSRFGGKFVAKPPQTATAVVAGRVAHNTISGTLTDRTKNQRTHKFCTGKASFKLTHTRRQAQRQTAAPVAGALPRLRALAAGITMPIANERPSRPKKTSKSRTSWIPESA